MTSARAGNVVDDSAGLVGRAADIDALDRLLPSERLVTLVGPAGVGKTRVARAFAVESKSTGDHTRWFVDLTPARDLEGICRLMATSLGVSLGPGSPPETIAGELVRRGKLLLILDNFEHVTDHGVATIALWHARAPETCFLITSRERLRLQAERVVELAPLGMPTEAAVEEADAVKLLLERVRRVRANFALDHADRGRVVELMRRLDALPLAIELAAPRVALFGIRGVLERLDLGYGLLSGGSRDLPPRHSALLESIAWSWQLLEPFEQSALEQCTVFRSTFTLDAAEAVLDLTAFPGADPLTAIESLREKSLLFDAPGETKRFGVYVSVREFVRSHATGMLGAAFVRHAAYFAETAEFQADAVEMKGDRDAVDWFAASYEDLVAIVDRSMNGAPDSAVLIRAFRVLSALAPHAGNKGLETEHLRRTEQAFEAAKPLTIPAGIRGVLRMFQGTFERTSGRAEVAVTYLEEALALAIEADLPELRVQAMRYGGTALFIVGRREEGYQLAKDALRYADNPRVRRAFLGLAATTAGKIAGHLGLGEEARTLHEQAREIFQSVGNDLRLGQVLRELGVLACGEGKFEQAIDYYKRSIAKQIATGAVVGEFATWEEYAALYQALGRLDDARAALDVAARLAPFAPRIMAASLPGGRGILEHTLGDLTAALALLRLAASESSAVGDVEASSRWAGHAACVLATQGKIAEARAALEAAMSAMPFATGAIARTARLFSVFIDVEEMRLGSKSTPAERQARATSGLRGALAAPGSPSVDIDFWKALSLFTVPLGAEGLRALEATARPESATVVVEAEGRWFMVPGGERIVCQRREPIRRLLMALGEARHKSPGRAVSQTKLIETLWPGERIQPQAARNRLHVAVTTLRKLGLGQLVVSNDDGYLLDPTALFRQARDA